MYLALKDVNMCQILTTMALNALKADFEDKRRVKKLNHRFLSWFEFPE